MGTDFEKLKDFIVKKRWDYDFPLERELSLQDDLLIYGDDADEFILAFSKEFNVDVSRFNISDYFKNEGDPVLPAIFNFLTGRKKRAKKRLTIGHLEKAILAGRLNEEVINS